MCVYVCLSLSLYIYIYIYIYMSHTYKHTRDAAPVPGRCPRAPAGARRGLRGDGKGDYHYYY